MSTINLGLSDGRIKVYVNKELYGDDRVIYINPGDINIFERAKIAEEKIKKIQIDAQEEINAFNAQKNADPTIMISVISRIDTEIRKAVDYIFDYNASKAVFGETNALADVNGKPYIEVFLSAILPVIKEHITSYGKSAKKRVDAVEAYIK